MLTVLLELRANLTYKTKTLISELATRFWNKLHYVRLKSKYFFLNLWEQENRIVTISKGHQYLREENKKTKGPKHDSHNQQRSPIPEAGEQENQRA